MTFRSWLCVSGLVCSAALAACGSDAPAGPMAMAGAGGTPDLHVDNPGSAGKAAAGSGGTSQAGSGGAAAGSGGAAGAAGGGGAAGMAAAGSGGSSAGAGGSGGAGGTGGAGGAGGSAGAAGAAGAPESDDPFADLFGPGQISCDGLLCLEDSNCAEFYPDETAACKFTKCVDFVCQ